MSKIPLLFTYRDRVVGMGFAAHVSTHGRVLAVAEGDEDQIWIYGVEPGALAASGSDPKEALEALREAFANVLRDFAADARDFASFEASVQAFFEAVNRPHEQEWRLAVEEVRAGRVDVQNLRREPAESHRFVEIREDRPVDQKRDFTVTGSSIKSVVAA